MSEIGMSQARIDEIELRLLGADHRPWHLHRQFTDESGRPIICKGSSKSWKKALNASQVFAGGQAAKDEHKQLVKDGLADRDMPDTGAPTHFNTADLRRGIALFKICQEATDEMGEFVAHAPQDVEDLLREVKFLRDRYRTCEKERDEFKKEMLSSRVEKATLHEKLSSARRLWRDLNKAMEGQ
jgi:hypothetical protein